MLPSMLSGRGKDWQRRKNGNLRLGVGGLINKIFSWGDDERVAGDYADFDETGGKDKWAYCALVGEGRSSWSHNACRNSLKSLCKDVKTSVI